MNLDYAKYLLKKTQQDYNRIAQDFSRRRQKPWPGAQFLVSNYTISGEKILDLGCGGGQWFEFFKEKKADYFGLDFSEDLIEIARNRYPSVDFRVSGVLNLPFADNCFDKVYAIALFHNLPSKEIRRKALKEAKRVLKKKGLLILTCWDLWQKRKTKKLIYKFILLKILGKSKLDFKDVLINWQGIENCYFHCFTKKELERFIREADFEIIKDGKFSANSKREKISRLSDSNFYFVAKKSLN